MTYILIFFIFFWLQLLVKFPFIGELPVNSVHAQLGPARPVENLARPGLLKICPGPLKIWPGPARLVISIF